MKPCRGSGGATGAAAGEATGTLSSSGGFARSFTSRLPRLEIDARIDPGVGQVRDQVYQEPEKREDVEVREHHRIVAVDDRLERQQAEPVEREDRLDQERAGEEGVDEGAGKARDDDQHGVAEDVPVQHPALGEAL